MTLTVNVMECESEPLVPIMVMVYPPIGVLCVALTLSVEVPCPPDVRAIEELLNDVLGPDVGETTAERLMVPVNPVPAATDRETVPENPPRLVAVRVDVSEEPASMLTVAPLDARVKSALCETVRARLTECERLPLVPVTKIV